MRTLTKVLSTFIFLFVSFCLHSQGNFQYVVKFADKANSPFSIDNPTEYLSQRAIERRERQGIEINETDLPVSPSYLQYLADIPSVDVLSKSKWFNDAVIETNDSTILKKILDEDFVDEIILIPGSSTKSGFAQDDKLESEYTSSSSSPVESEYGAAWRQFSILNADYLHLRGYRGQGMRIAVLDAGYSFTWFSEHFKKLNEERRIIDVYNFINDDDSVYEDSYHGTYVLSTMASDLPDSMIGTSPDAEYVLLRSEDVAGEYILEEYFWTEAAEFADSAGCDILNSSLGYTTFDDSLQNHTWADLDGQTTRITLSADKAHQTGMLIFNSAGNSGDKAWQRIGAPADAFDVLSIGAVDSSGTLAAFSSRGPTADGRIKPDILAVGEGAVIGLIDGGVAKSNGTSFASPILAGAAACLWQANPESTNEEVRSALIQSASLFQNPDTNNGYGIPDLILADQILKGNLKKGIRNGEVMTFPNPFQNELFILLDVKKNEILDLVIFDLNGREVYRDQRRISHEGSQYIYLSSEISSLGSGMYVITLNSESIDLSIKVVRE